MSNNAVTDERDVGLFVPSEIDDYGLDPYEFRIYARIVRRAGRGDAWESIPKMARACRMSESRARAALQLLQAAGLIESAERKGDTTIRRLTPKRYWAHPEQLDEIRSNLTRTKAATPSKTNRATRTATRTKTDTPCRSNTTTPGKTGTGVVAEVIPPPLAKLTDEGIPLKDLPLRYSPEAEAATEPHSCMRENLFFQPQPLETTPPESKLLGKEECPDPDSPNLLLSPTVTDKPQDSNWGNSSAAVEPDLQREIERMAFDWRKCPWMSNATEFQPQMKAAVWRSNPQEYSIAGTDVPNETYICNHLRKLQSRLKNPTDAYSAYVKLQTYWKTALALTNPEIQSEFSQLKVAAKQAAIQSQLEQRKQHTFEAIKDLL